MFLGLGGEERRSGESQRQTAGSDAAPDSAAVRFIKVIASLKSHQEKQTWIS